LVSDKLWGFVSSLAGPSKTVGEVWFCQLGKIAFLISYADGETRCEFRCALHTAARVLLTE